MTSMSRSEIAQGKDEVRFILRLPRGPPDSRLRSAVVTNAVLFDKNAANLNL
jgi:hypothetical protein